jgi:DNA-binding response OmpR family regulator
MTCTARLAVVVFAAATVALGGCHGAVTAPPAASRRPIPSAASRPASTGSRSRSTTTARVEGCRAGGTISAGGGAVPEAEKGRGLVLVVEDDRSIADLVGLYLRRDGFGVQVESDGAAALAAVRRLRPAAVVLDVGLPGMDGVEVCRRLRAEDDWTPVLFVTARDDEIDRVLGLEMGADDYVTKPFSPRELVARVRTVLRRSERVAEREEVLAVGEVRIEVDRRRAHAAGREVALTSTEFDLLTHLMRAPGRVFTREQLLSAVWGYTASAGTRTVDVHVAQLRAKLGAASPIRTVRGVGYAADRP